MNSGDVTFGDRLKYYRERYGINQTKLAEAVFVDHSYISRLETGARDPSREVVDRIAAALDLDKVETRDLVESAGFLYAQSSQPRREEQYGFVVIACEEGGYVIEFPDLPGCITQADDYLEIAYMARDALATWLEAEREQGHQIPEPTKGEVPGYTTPERWHEPLTWSQVMPDTLTVLVGGRP